MFQPSLTANNQALKAVGRSDLCLKLEIIKKTIGILLIVSTMFINVYALAFSNVLFACVSMIINIFPNRKIIKYGYREQFKDMLPPLLLSLIMGATVFPISFIPIRNIFILIIQISLGIGIYIGGSLLFKFSSFYVLLSFIKSFLKKKKTDEQ